MKQVMFAHQTDNVLRRFLKILFDEGLTEKIHFYVNKVGREVVAWNPVTSCCGLELVLP